MDLSLLLFVLLFSQPCVDQHLLYDTDAITFIAGANCGAEDEIYNEQVKNEYFKDGVELTKMNTRLQPNTNPAKNVILFLGDGMGISTTTAARIFDGQSRDESGEENVLSWETFPYTALSKTYNTDVQVPDSAGTATAYGTGVKTREGILGLTGKAIFGNCSSAKGNEVLSILTFAELAGMSTGLITNTRVTHATPGAFYSHTPSRDWENDQSAQGTCVDISRQLIEYQYGNGIDVVLGGGWRSFLPCGSKDPEGRTFEDKTKCRNDGRNLTNEWLKKYNNSAVVWNKDELKKIDPDKVDHLLGLFASSGMEYEVLRPEKNRTHEPSFNEMVEKAIEILRKNPKGFFLMAEGGLIDWAHHDNNAHLALSETASMAKAVKKAQDVTNADETLILVTADHSHSFTHSGNVKRGNPIFGFQSKLALDGKPALSLSYADGQVGLTVNQTRANLTGVNYNDTGFLQQALIKMEYESHSAEDVGIYATGPFAHLFHGVVEQSYIFHVMDYALCLTKSKQEICTKPPDRGGPTSHSVNVQFSAYLLIMTLVVSYVQS